MAIRREGYRAKDSGFMRHELLSLFEELLGRHTELWAASRSLGECVRKAVGSPIYLRDYPAIGSAGVPDRGNTSVCRHPQ